MRSRDGAGCGSLVERSNQKDAPLFGLFKSRPFQDARLGAFERTRGLWRGTLSLDAGSDTPLALSGDRAQPDPQALAIAHDLPRLAQSLRPAIAEALFEHYEPYAESADDGDAPPRIAAPAEIWPHVTLLFVSVTPLSGALTAELGYRVAWDDEHTLGARLRDGALLELNGSVLAP